MTHWAYYNEIDEFAAEWLRNLIARGLIAPGVVDTRSIADVRPYDLRGFTQCHFFAGIGVWSYALRRSGWGDDRRVWTGSCPCQPFSAAGRGGGLADERHLWPFWYALIEQHRPAVIFGEQVASKDAEPWLDLVQDDLEAMDYAVGAVPFPAASVGAPHIRDRLYWVAHAAQSGRAGITGGGQARVAEHREAGVVADLPGARSQGSERAGQRPDAQRAAVERGGEARELADADGGDASAEREQRSRQYGQQPQDGGAVRGFWAGADWIACRDGKARPVEPGTFPLAHGAPARVGRLRGYGNAIVAPQAQVFIEAVMECMA